MLKRFNYIKWLKRIVILVSVIYILLCTLVYFFQEKLIFHPDVLALDMKYEFDGDYEELNIKMDDGTLINSLLFKAKESKGCVFYLHGNAGSLRRWGDIHELYTGLGYDLFIFDYRGFGKSEGEITSEEVFYNDLDKLYDFVADKYNRDSIVIIGYSIGTGPAAMLASKYQPAHLILKAPYFNLTDRMHYQYPFLPSFLLKYKFATDEFITKVKCPITIFHGDKDDVIYYGSSLKLKEFLKKEDELITIPEFGHNGMNKNEVYTKGLEKIISEL